MPRLRGCGLDAAFVDALAALPTPVRSVEQLVTADAARLAAALGIPRSDVIESQGRAAALFSAPFVRADKLLEAEETQSYALSTGCATLDAVLGGGLQTGEVTELFGAAGSGKTQVCLSALASLLVSTDSTAVHIDTGGALSAERLTTLVEAQARRVAQHFEVRVDEVLGRLETHTAFDADAALATLHAVEARIGEQEEGSCRMLMLDCITALVAPLLFVGEGAAVMAQIAHVLRRIASEHGVAVVVTNNVVYDRDRGGGTKAALGRWWAFEPDVQVAVWHDHAAAAAAGGGAGGGAASTLRGAELRKSPRVPTPQEVQFRIEPDGVAPHAQEAAVPVSVPWRLPGGSPEDVDGDDVRAGDERGDVAQGAAATAAATATAAQPQAA